VVKGSLCARFGIRDYWIVNLVERLIEVYRDPESGDRARLAFRYRLVKGHHAGQPIVPQALGGAVIAVSDLLS
jgi:Uma2 family endonuclease